MAKVRQDFPRYELMHTFEAVIPSYAIQLVMEVLEQRTLNPFQTYILQFLGLDVQTLEECAYFLGVEPEMLDSSIIDLLKMRYAEQRVIAENPPTFILALTPTGKVALDKDGPPPVPTRASGRFSWNALTWQPFLQEGRLLYPDEAAKAGFVALPASETEKPTLGTFIEEDIIRVFKNVTAFQKKNIVRLLNLKSAQLRYIGPVTVAVLQHQETQEKTVAVYSEGVQQKSETAALQRVYEAKRFALPTEAVVPHNEQPIPTPPSLPSNIAQDVQERIKQEQALEELEIQVEANKMQKSATQDEREREELEQQFRQLQEDLRRKSQEITQLNQQLHQQRIEFLPAEQHHNNLLQALRTAKEEVIIITSRLNRTACNAEVRRLMVEATRRGVRVRIGYGVGNERNQEIASRDHHEMAEIKKALKKEFPNMSDEALEDIVETSGSSQRILICDRQFAIAGNFNWLSSLGIREKGYQRAYSAVYLQHEVVDELAHIALQTWKTRSAAFLNAPLPRKKKERRS